MIPVKNSIAILFVLVFAGCQSSTGSKKKDKDDKEDETAAVVTPQKYDLAHPVKRWELSDSLKEISGITWVSDNELLAIEDLHPNLYLLKLDDQVKIEKNVSFLASDKNKVDIEDVALVGDVVYALWSHGTVYKITDWQNKLQVKEINTNFSKENNTEGMCYDPDTKKLLLACKDESELADEKKSTRAVYAMDVNDDKVNPDPFIVIRKKDFKKIADEKFDFYPSAIAVDPISHNIFILSTKDTKCLAEYSPAGELVSFQLIDKDLMPQPEGLCFSPNGTMYISSEGRHKEPARLFQFNPAR